MKGLFKKLDKNIIWAVGINWTIVLFVFAIFIIPDGGLFTLSNDFDAQELAFNIFANRSIKQGEIFFNWAIDLGSDFTASFSFYNLGSIFFWLSLLFPAESFPYLIVWIYTLKYATAGLTAYIYLRGYCQDKRYAIIGSILYSFCGYQATNLVFYHFHDVVAFFPLLLLGLDYMIDSKKWGRMAVAVAINALVNWNFFVGEVIFLIIYYLCKYDVLKRLCNKRYKEILLEIFRCLIEGILGVGMAAVLFVPSVYAMLSNSRISRRILGENALVFSTQQYLELIKAFLFPNEPMCYQSALSESNWYSVATYLPMVGIIFVVAYLIVNRRDWISKLLWISLIMAMIPVLNSSFVLFYEEPYRRWFYMPILIMALASMIVLEELAKNSLIRKIVLNCTKATFLAVIFLTVYLFLYKWSEQKKCAINDTKRFQLYVWIAILGIVCVGVCIKYFYKCKFFISIFLSLVSLFSAVCLYVNIVGYRQKSDWNTPKEVYNEIVETAKNLPSDTIPYRYAMSNPYYNRNMANSLTSIDSFISTVDNGIVEFYDSIRSHRHTMTNDGPDGTNELLSVKYYVMDEYWENVNPKQILNNGNKNIYIYEDYSALPIGFTYDSYITKSEFEQVSPEIMSYVMMRVLVIKDDDVYKVKNVLAHYDMKGGQEFSSENKQQDILLHHQECSIEFTHSTTSFASKMIADRSKYAFFSVPYGKRWSARVNDMPVEILDVNGLMAVPIGAGENNIVFEYNIDINKISLLISFISIGIVAFLFKIRTTKNLES